MNNRWGRQLETKGSLRGSGQNNINININFNALKDKANVFGGKKIDNFIQINNQPKQSISRPNVSMQTLKQKKKKLVDKQQFFVQQEIKRKKSKSKIVNDICTPQKIYKERQSGNSRSVGKKSTKKRSAKSYDNLKKFYDRNSPRQISKQQQKSKTSSQEQSKSNSKSRSKSRSQSNKKMTKIPSKGKIPTNSTNTRAKNSNHNSKNNKIEEIINPFQKTKKVPVKKTDKQKQKIIEPSPQTPLQTISRKASAQRINRKRSTQDEPKKVVNKVKTPRKKSKQKQSKSLKRLPLFYQEQPQNFDEQGSYQKVQKQAHKLLYQEQSINKKPKKDKKQKQPKRKKQTAFDRYLQSVHTYDDIVRLTDAAIYIQKIWRGYRVRSQFINQLNMLNHKIQITRNKIANQDPKFWDDAQSNSILKAQDAQSQKSSRSKSISQIQSDIQKPISSHSSNHQSKMTRNRIIQYPQYPQHHQMLQRISKLQQILRKQQVKAQQLEQQNKQLKVNLQKVSIQSVQSGINSAVQSMQSSFKSGQQWSLSKNKYQQDPFLEQQSNKKKFKKLEQQQEQEEQKEQEQFQLKLPKRIINNIKKQPIKKQQIPQKQPIKPIHYHHHPQHEQQNKDNKFKIYKNKMQSYQCSSPKYQISQVNIDKGLIQLFKKKQDQLKQTYDKKMNMFDRMLNQSVFSPRTIKIKKNQIQQKFKQQTQIIRKKVDLISKAVDVIQQLKDQQVLITDLTNTNTNINLSKAKQQIKTQLNKKQLKQIKQFKPTAIIKQKNHIIQDYGNMNLNSHRSKSQSQQLDNIESSQQLQAHNKSIFKRIQQPKQSKQSKQKLQQNQKQKQKQKQQNIIKQLNARNNQAIKIFSQISSEQSRNQHLSQEQQQQSSQNNNNNTSTKQIQRQSQSQSQSQQSQQPPRLQNNSSQVFRSQSQLSQKKKFRGLETTLLFIKQYCVSFVQFIRSSQQHKNTFIQGICTPIVYDSYQFLKSYRTTMTHQNQSSYNSQQKQYIYPYFKLIYPKSQVITRQAFNQFNLIYDKLQGQCQFLAQREFFLNSLLDAFNQSLDNKRPCSIYGQPPKWISQSRALKNYYLMNPNHILDRQNFLKSQKFDQICGVAIARVIEWSTSLCGFIPQSPQMQNVVIEQQQINHIRQTRIALMLEKDLLENQENILDFIIEQTQVKLQISTCIMEDLVMECVRDCYGKFFK